MKENSPLGYLTLLNKAFHADKIVQEKQTKSASGSYRLSCLLMMQNSVLNYLLKLGNVEGSGWAEDTGFVSRFLFASPSLIGHDLILRHRRNKIHGQIVKEFQVCLPNRFHIVLMNLRMFSSVLPQKKCGLKNSIGQKAFVLLEVIIRVFGGWYLNMVKGLPELQGF